MGYRHYFYIVDKFLINDINNCKTEEDVYKLFLKHGFKTEKESCDGDIFYYSPLYNLPGMAFELGKYYENANNVLRLGKPLFESDVLRECYEENYPVYGGEELLLEIIRAQEKCIVEMYEDLVHNTFSASPNSKNAYAGMDEREVHYQRLLEHCEDYLYWWKTPQAVVDVDKKRESLTKSWLYEHSIFDLVRLYKSFDASSQYVLFFGY